jgi:hypothetical protein
MDTGQTDLADFGRQLQVHDGEAHVRTLLVEANGGWTLYHLWAMVGAEPPDWHETTWLYERLCFVACRVPVGNLAALCSTEVGAVLILDEIEAVVLSSLGPANWTRRPSFAAYDRVPLPVPVTDFQISVADANLHLPHQMLAGENCPSFPEPNSAWRALPRATIRCPVQVSPRTNWLRSASPRPLPGSEAFTSRPLSCLPRCMELPWQVPSWSSSA